jgi:TolB-like protein/Tfp pilus assembly protein PilF/tRNA A-37 threonylcarbamoyl transferase component Bud32
LIGQTISHYKILDKLGEGGMGVVYKARDTRLDRTVALKFLAPQLVSNEDVRRRFIREAKTAAGLQHPNICTVHEIVEADGLTFIAMAFLEGRELADEIAAGPIEPRRALDLAVQFAEGLAEAHRKGVVHRDIKPANLFVTSDGRGVILDFGLAQLASANSKLTREGTTLGTCAYMSPEQTSGSDVDARTDVWALGCVLYEMLAGQPPFRGDYEQAIIYSILNEEPETLPSSAASLASVARKSLSKRASDRYRDGSELLTALRGVSTAEREPTLSNGRTPARPTVVVLPFQNRGRDEEDDYFADGVTEDVINALGKLEGLRVIPRGSAFQFKGKRPALHELVDLLRVSHVLDGSVRQAGDRLRITVELIEAAEGEQLWTERYDRVVADIFDVQDEISQAIAQALKAKFSGVTPSPARVRRTDNLDAYRLYLKGRQCSLTLSEAGQREAIRCFEKALEHDPGYLELRSGLADAYSMLGVHEQARPAEVFPKAKEEALRALELDKTVAAAHASLALVQFSYDRDFAGAEQSFRRAIELDPDASACRAYFSWFLGCCGRSGEAIAQCRTAVELDPMGPFVNRVLALAMLFGRDYDAALQQVKKTLDIASSYFPARWEEAYACHMLGRHDDALRAIEAAHILAPKEPLNLAYLGFHQAAAGREQDALRTIEQLKSIRSQRYVGAVLISLPYLQLGDFDSAFEWLETAFEEKDALLVMLKHHPPWAAFAKDPRFQGVLRRIGMP